MHKWDTAAALKERSVTARRSGLIYQSLNQKSTCGVLSPVLPLKKDVRNCRGLQLMDCCFSMDWNDLSNSKRLCLFCGLQVKHYLCGAVRNSIVNIWTTVLGIGSGSEGQNSGDGVGMGKEFLGRGGDGDRNNGDGWGWGPILVPMQLSSVDTLLRWGGKSLHDFAANLFRKL